MTDAAISRPDDQAHRSTGRDVATTTFVRRWRSDEEAADAVRAATRNGRPARRTAGGGHRAAWTARRRAVRHGRTPRSPPRARTSGPRGSPHLSTRCRPEPRETPPPPPPPPPPRSLEQLAAAVTIASEASERNDWAIGELRASTDRLTARLDELALRFQTQLCDLGFEIERAAASTRTSAAVSDLTIERQVDALRAAQIRIASEQARFEIAVRSELAELADHLRRFP